jgi:hypothetical protein
LYRSIPSYTDCLQIADYNHGNGGFPEKSIRKLEKRFKCGVHYETSCGKPEISDIFRLSVIVSFTTSENGWEAIARGELLHRPPGNPDGWHSTLVEAYDLDKDYSIGKNSWGHKAGTQERFKFRFEAFHDFDIVKVFFTMNTIIGKTLRPFVPRMVRFNGFLDGRPIACAYMDADTAKYDSEFICEVDHSRSPPLNWIGYEQDRYISIKLKRS